MPFLWIVMPGQRADEGRRFDLLHDAVTIGRGPENNLVIEDDLISRHHARIVKTMRGWVLADAGSANGLHVGPQRVESVRLKEGVVVRIGNATLTYRDLTHNPTVVASGGAAAGPPTPVPGPARTPAKSGPLPPSPPSPPPVVSPPAAGPALQAAPPDAPAPVPRPLPAVPMAPVPPPVAPPAFAPPPQPMPAPFAPPAPLGPPPPVAARAPRPRRSTGVTVAIVLATLVILGSGGTLVWQLSTSDTASAPSESATTAVAAAPTPKPPAGTASPAAKATVDAASAAAAPPPPAANGDPLVPAPDLGFAGAVAGRALDLDGSTGGWLGLENGARLDVPAGAFDGKLRLTLLRGTTAALPALVEGARGDTYYVVADRPGRRTGALSLALPYDPAALPAGADPAKLGVVAVYDGRYAWPLTSRVDAAKHVVVVEEPELGVLDPGATAGFARAVGDGEPRPASPPPRIGHVVFYAVNGHPFLKTGPCDTARAGETHWLADQGFQILVAADTSCAFVKQVADTLQEALAIYQREFPGKDGTPPFDRWSSSPGHRMSVELRPMSADFPAAVYSPLGWGGSMAVDAVRADVPANEAATFERELRVTLFHELFHGVQDMHRNMFAAYWGGRMWWYEATAEWAGRKFSLRSTDAVTPFDDMVDAALRPGHGTPYVLAVPIDESRSWHGGMASYHYALLVEWVEQQSAGSIKRTLQDDVTSSDDLLQRLYGDGRLAETYQDFLVRFWTRGNGGLWAQFRLMETGLETREWRPAGDDIGAAPGDPVALTKQEQRYPEGGRAFSFELAPATARFFWLRASAPVNPNLMLGVYVETGGAPLADGLLLRPAAEGPPLVERLPADFKDVAGFGKDFFDLWIVVFRPVVAGEDRTPRRYAVHLNLRPDCGYIPPTCIGRPCRPSPEAIRWQQCQEENERWLAEVGAGTGEPASP